METEQNELVSEITVGNITCVLMYSNQILQSENLVDDSDLYSKLALFKGDDYKALLTTFAEYFNVIYPQLFFYQTKQEFNTCSIINQAVERELKFICSFFVLNYPEIKEDLKQMQQTFIEFYLLD